MKIKTWQNWLRTTLLGTKSTAPRRPRARALGSLECLEPKTLLTAPVATNGMANTPEDVALNGMAEGSDADGDQLIFSVVSQPKHGTLNFSLTGQFLYTPNPNYSGADSFTFRTNDGQDNSNTATFSITVMNGDDDPPVIIGGSSKVMIDTPLNGTVAKSASDPEGGPIEYSVVGAPMAGAMVNMNLNGTFTYTPKAGFSGADSFTFRASDGVNFSETVTFNLTVVNNQAPVVENATIYPNEDQAYNGSLSQYVTDINNDPLTFSATSMPQHGTLNLSANGTFIYTPNANFIGTDSFKFKANDGLINSAEATIEVSISEVDDPLKLTFPGGVTQIPRNSSPVRIDPGVTLTDPDTTVDYSNAQIRALVSSGNTNGDYQKGRIALKVLSQGMGVDKVYVDGSKIYFNGNPNHIATFTGGTLGRSLVIKFKGTATAADVKAVLRQISMVASKKASSAPATNNNPVGVRLVDVTVSAGGQKALATKTVSVI